MEQRTEIVVSYLKGEAIQWWRGTGFLVANMPWHRFCSQLTDRFAGTSVCENVKAFHSLTQTSTVAHYISAFEQNMNLMRRDNPAVPDSYYMHSFISGLNPYIQSHLECHQPERAMWLARRIEKSCPTPTSYKNSTSYYKKQSTVELNKPTAPLVTPAATITTS